MALNLPRIIGRAVKLADRLTSSTQVTVEHHVMTAHGASGPEYGTQLKRKALWEDEERVFRTGNGQEAVSIGKLTFPRPVQVGALDRFWTPGMPADATAPVMRPAALMDPHGVAYLREVWLGTFAGSS